MAGLREIKKEKTRNDILQYAEKLFKEKGFKNVTTSEIAKGVGVAEGTLFNYFSSKGELFLEALFGRINKEKYIPDKIQDIDEEKLVNELINIIDFYMKDMTKVKKIILKDYFSVVFNVDTAESLSTRKSLFGMDEKIMRELKFFLNRLKDENKDLKTFNSDIAVECIYGTVILQLTKYIYDDEYNYSGVIENLKKEIQFIIHGNII